MNNIRVSPHLKIIKLSRHPSPEEMGAAINYVLSLLAKPDTFHENEIKALASFYLTTRKGSLPNSVLFKLLNANERHKAAKEMQKPQWCKVDGEVKKRLKKLRAAQAELFLEPVCIKGGKDGG